jgi:hypothetical protein
MRLVLTPACVEHAGRDVRWADGVACGPEGEALRPIAFPGTLYTWSTWISRDGTLYDRVYDPFCRAFAWSQSKSMCLDARADTTPAFQVCIGTGSAARVVRLARAIAMAWVEAPRSESKLQAVPCGRSGDDGAMVVLWLRTGVRQFEVIGYDDVPEPIPPPMPSSSWRPLSYAWHDASGRRAFALSGAAAASRRCYMISSDGWLYSPFSGASTRGIRAPDQRLWATIEDHGLVWMDVAVLCSFADALPAVRDGARPVAMHVNGLVDDNRACNLRWEYVGTAPLAPGVARTVASLCAGDALYATAEAEGVSRATIWSRLATALAEGAAAERAAVRALVPRSVIRNVAEAMGRTSAAERLTRLVTECAEGPASRVLSTMDEDADRVGIVRLARIIALEEEQQGTDGAETTTGR